MRIVFVCLLILQTIEAAKRPHIFMHIVDDFGWANAGWHRPDNYSETVTPTMNELLRQGIELDRAYSYQFCSPSRCSFQSGRLPVHVNTLNIDVTSYNPKDPVSGFQGIPRNMTGIATKLSSAGYSCHQVGKWDAGMATMDHTPYGRGYNSSLGYFHHFNSYWDEESQPFVDLWDTKGPALTQNNSCQSFYRNHSACPAVGHNPFYTIGPDQIYEEKFFVDRVLEIIDKHDPDSDGPLYINYDSHIVHSPLQVPMEYYYKFDFMKNDWDKHRQLYAAMVNYLDDGVAKIVQKLKDKNMWQDTIWFTQSDNGGPSFTGDNHTANNFPLKGAKYTNWEGGIRVNAFVSGGYLSQVAPQRIGTKLEGYITIADYYATFCEIAGVDPTDHRAAEAKLPPIDSISMWSYLTGKNDSSPRNDIFIDYYALLKGRYKILTSEKLKDGKAQVTYACYPGEVYPNASHPLCVRNENCPNGACLYDIFADPTEHINLSNNASYKDTLDDMLKTLSEMQKTFFNPHRTGGDQTVPIKAAQDKWHGFWGPFLD